MRAPLCEAKANGRKSVRSTPVAYLVGWRVDSFDRGSAMMCTFERGAA